MVIRMRPFTMIACVALSAMLCTAVSQAGGKPGVVRITDNHREQQLISNPIRLVSFDSDDDSCMPPPPVCKVPTVEECAPPVKPAVPKCDENSDACCPTAGGGCCDNSGKRIYRCHDFDCRGRCGRCDDDHDECDCDACKDSRKRWKKWRKWARKNGGRCGNNCCGNGACGNGQCGNGACGNGACGNGQCGNGYCGNGQCGNGFCGNSGCRCGNCPGDGCRCGGKKKWWDPLGLCSGGDDCGDDNKWCGLRHHGRGGYGLFGGDCGYDTYRAGCEKSWFQRWAHRKHCRRNALALQAYRRDGFGWGTYHIAYPLNPNHFDARDGRVYAAQGYGIPMAVPVAPNVEHTYNYSWGLPASRITPMSTPGQRSPLGRHDDHYGARIILNP